MVPHTATIAEEHTGGFFAPKTLKGHVQSAFLRSGGNFYIREGGVPLYRKLPAKTAAGMAEPPESLMGISSKPLGIFSSTLQPVADIR